MQPDDLNARLSRLSTQWSDVLGAHEQGAEYQLEAQRSVLERYQRPVYRYLLGSLRNPEAADEVFQEFALQFLRGAFRNVDPQRGRFRDYLKTTLVHLVWSYRKKQQSRAKSLDASVTEPAAPQPQDALAEQEFANDWRHELLDRAWAALDKMQHETGQPYFTVLQFRTKNVDATAAQMAEQLTRELNPERPFTDTGIRKTLQRAREWFAHLLLDEVAHTLANPKPQQLEEELIDLGLIEYCRQALAQRR